MSNKFHNFLHTLESCWLCMKYPFLYPRNRFSGKHYNNWKIDDYLNGYQPNGKWNKETNKMEYPPKVEGIYQKAFHHELFVLDTPDPDGSTYRAIHYTKNYLYASWYYIVLFVYNFIIRPFHCIPTYTEWDSMPIGWKKAFGNEYLEDLKIQLKKDKMLYSWRIHDIKEKWGTLQLYCNFGSAELYKIISEYEDLSYHTCINCGKHATVLSGGWICPYCDDCFNNDNHIYKIPMYIEKDGEWVYNPEMEKLEKEREKEEEKLKEKDKPKRKYTKRKNNNITNE